MERKQNVGRNTPEYRASSKAAKKAIRSNRNADVTDTCKLMREADRKGDSKGVFRQLQKLASKVAPTSTTTKGSAGKVLTKTGGILESWRVCCDNLYHKEDASATNVSLPVEAEMEPVPLSCKVATALKLLSAGKAVRPDEIPIE